MPLSSKDEETGIMGRRGLLGGIPTAVIRHPGEEAPNGQPDCLKNAHPWISITERNGRTVAMRPKGNRRKSFARKADGVVGRDRCFTGGSSFR